jgi:hypothetical protein
MSTLGIASSLSFLERNWPWLFLAAPVAVYAGWIASLVVPEVVRVVVPEVVRAVVGR